MIIPFYVSVKVEIMDYEKLSKFFTSANIKLSERLIDYIGPFYVICESS